MATKIVLGFSGGLDTSFCVKYLSEDKGFEVHSIIVNTGGFSEEELKKRVTLLYSSLWVLRRQAVGLPACWRSF